MKNIPDYRCERKKPHKLEEMLTCLIAAYINNRTSVGRAIEWCRNHIDLLRKHMKLEHGIASEPTMSRMLNGIDEEIFSLTFMEWIAEILEEKGIHIIIDGKALRGGTERIRGRGTPYVLNAIDAASELVIGQLAISEKANEITAIPKLLDILNIQDNTFTIDAIGTQKKIENQIVENGGHFVLQVKKNNPALYDEIIASFDAFEKEKKEEIYNRTKVLQKYIEKVETWSSQERNRERMEYRNCQICKDATFLECVREGERPYLKSVGCITQIRIPIEKDEEGNDITVSKEEFLKKGSHRKPFPQKGDGQSADIQKVGMISDRVMSAEEMAIYKRRHWKIENNLHHVLDDTFREDRSSARGSRNNLSLIRKIAYNVLRLAEIIEEMSHSILKTIDYFSDHPEMTEKYIFSEIVSFY